jgi:hypothetical protein
VGRSTEDDCIDLGGSGNRTTETDLHSGILCFYGVTSGLGQGDRCITAGSFLFSERVDTNTTAYATAVDDMSMIPLGQSHLVGGV